MITGKWPEFHRRQVDELYESKGLTDIPAEAGQFSFLMVKTIEMSDPEVLFPGLALDSE